MKIHPYFTFIHFAVIAVILLVATVLVCRSKKIPYIKLLNWKVMLLSLLPTFLGAFYKEHGFSGMYRYRSYGFPRKIFEIYNNIDGTTPVVRVYSQMNWGYLLQNWILFYLFINLIFILFKNENHHSKTV